LVAHFSLLSQLTAHIVLLLGFTLPLRYLPKRGTGRERFVVPAATLQPGGRVRNELVIREVGISRQPQCPVNDALNIPGSLTGRREFGTSFLLADLPRAGIPEFIKPIRLWITLAQVVGLRTKGS